MHEKRHIRALPKRIIASNRRNVRAAFVVSKACKVIRSVSLMKWFIGVSTTLALCVLAYLASAWFSLDQLVTAARHHDGARLLQLTDVPRVRHSLVDQIITAYLHKIGALRPVKPFERMAIETFGASIADEVVIKLTTAENLSALLGAGLIRDTNAVEFGKMSALAGFDISDPAGTLTHIRPVKLVEFSLQLGADPSAGAISMHFEGRRWKLSGINLPATAIGKLVDRLPSR